MTEKATTEKAPCGCLSCALQRFFVERFGTRDDDVDSEILTAISKMAGSILSDYSPQAFGVFAQSIVSNRNAFLRHDIEAGKKPPDTPFLVMQITDLGPYGADAGTIRKEDLN